MTDTTIDPLLYDHLERLETALARLRYVVITVVVVMIAGFAVLGVQVGRMDGRIDRLAAKVDGIDATLGVRFDGENTKLEATSQRLAAEFKKMGAEMTAQTSALATSIAEVRSAVAPSPPTPVQPARKPGPVQPARKPGPVQPPRNLP